MTCPIPIILSLVLKIGARDMLKQAKHMLSKIIMTKMPRILRGLRIMLILRIKASMTTATAWNRPLARRIEPSLRQWMTGVPELK